MPGRSGAVLLRSGGSQRLEDADDAVVVVGDVNVSGAVQRQASRPSQCCAGSWSTITGKPRHAVARHRGDDPAWRDHADAFGPYNLIVDAGSRQEQVAGAVHRQGSWKAYIRADGRP